MDSKDFFAFVAFVGVVMVPVLAVTARFALKPIVESIVRLREGLAAKPQTTIGDPDQLRLLQQEVSDLRTAVEQLRDVVEFERALKAPAGAPQITGGKTS